MESSGGLHDTTDYTRYTVNWCLVERKRCPELVLNIHTSAKTCCKSKPGYAARYRSRYTEPENKYAYYIRAFLCFLMLHSVGRIQGSRLLALKSKFLTRKITKFRICTAVLLKIRLAKRYSLSIDKQLPTFRKIVVISTSGQAALSAVLLGWFYC
jgi:hypothetical protein